MNPASNPEQLRSWIDRSLNAGENILATSNQGTILLFQEGGQELIIKTAMGTGLALKIRRKTLLREYQAYLRMEGLRGIPRCYGMIDGCYLLIEHIRGKPYRQAEIKDREEWFSELHAILASIHARGVSHGDLKTKGNLLVTQEGKPCVIDFGTAFIEKPGFHPVNNWLFRMGRRLDLNAWVKHKYHGDYSAASAQDQQLLDYSWLEMMVRKLSGRSMRTVRPRRHDPK